MVVERLAIAKPDVSFFRGRVLRAGRVQHPAHAPMGKLLLRIRNFYFRKISCSRSELTVSRISSRFSASC